MIDPVISYGAIISSVLVVVGFIGGGLLHAIVVGRYFGRVDEVLIDIRRRVTDLEHNESKIADVLVTIAEQRSAIAETARRIDDMQKYGSHRLAEVLEAMRGQIVGDFKSRIDELQAQIFRLSRGHS